MTQRVELVGHPSGHMRDFEGFIEAVVEITHLCDLVAGQASCTLRVGAGEGTGWIEVEQQIVGLTA